MTPLSRSSASESCEDIATSEFDEILSMFSREAILAILAFGDIEDALKENKQIMHIHMDVQNQIRLNVDLLE